MELHRPSERCIFSMQLLVLVFAFKRVVNLFTCGEAVIS